MASSTPACSICELRNIYNPSEVWCSDCTEALCRNCKEHHACSRSTKSHTTISIDEYLKLPADILSIKEYCDRHDEKFQLFCRKHSCPCCRVCVTKDHGKCNDKVLLENVIQNVKISNNFEETEQLINEIFETVCSIRKDIEINVKSIVEQRKSIEKNIRKARYLINNHLDMIEAELKKELTIAENQITTKANDLITSLDKEQHKLTENQITLIKLKKYGSDLQTYCVMNKIQDETRAEDKYLRSLMGQGRLDRTHISVRINSNLLEAILAIQHFGEIKFESQPTKIEIKRSKDKQAQIMVPPPKSIDTIRVTAIREIKTQGQDVTGCLVLPCGTAALSYSDEKLIRFFNRSDFKIAQVKTQTRTYDMVYIKDINSKALTCGEDDKQCIALMDYGSKKVKKTIPVGSYNSGITQRNHTLYFCGGDKGLRMINLHDNSILDVGTGPLFCVEYVATFNDKLYYTNCMSSSVTSCDFQGKTLWQFKDKNILSFLLGIDCDNDGNIYVVDGEKDSVVVISPDGSHCRQLLSVSDGLHFPRVLHYERSDNTLLVANLSDSAFLYDVNK